MSKKIVAFFIFSFLFLFLSVAYSRNANVVVLKVDPHQVIRLNTRSNCLNGVITLTNPSNWYAQATLTITNNCSTAQNLDQAIVSFQSNSTNMSTMWGGANSSSAFSYTGNIASAVLNITTGQTAPGQQLVLNFGINLNGSPFDLTDANNTLSIVPNNPIPTGGEIDVTVDPTGVTGVNSSSEIDITGPGLSQPYVILNANWSSPSTYKVTGLSNGTYTITAKPISNLYTGIATPSSVTVSCTSTAQVTVTYQPMVASGSLQLNLGAAPMQGLQSSVNAQIIDNTANQTQTVNVAWNGSQLVPNLPAGHNYTITFPQVSNGEFYSVPNSIPSPVITQNTTTIANITYQTPQPMPTEAVTFNVSGLAASVTGSVKIVDTYGNTFSNSGFGNGSFTQSLPTNDTFAVTASAPNMTATVTPSTFTLQNGSPAPTISIQFTAQPANSSHFFAYADTGMQSNNDGLTPSKGANMVEAFILYNASEGKSDLWAIQEGDPISQIIQNTPNTFASVGGANGPYSWDNETVSKAVPEIEALVDYYHFIGIDFDVEGAALETPAVQQWVAAAVAQLRKDRPNLILTLTVPDPVTGFTTGTVAILKQTLSMNNNQMIFNWVNKMDFDEGGEDSSCTQTSTNMNNNCLIISASTGAQQLASMLGISQQQAYQYLGEIFMIPVDDQGNSLPLSLATTIATTLKNMGLTHMGYWRLQNDTNLSYGNMFTNVLGLS